MSESETGIVFCEDIRKCKIRTRDRGSNGRDGNSVGVMFARKGGIYQGSGWKRIIIRSCGTSCGQAVCV